MQKKNRHKPLIKSKTHLSNVVIISLVLQMAQGLTLKYQYSVESDGHQVKQELTLNLKEGKGQKSPLIQ